MRFFTNASARITPHKRRILVRRLATVAFLAGVAMSHPLSAHAQELTPLRENKQKLNNILSFMRADGEIKYFAPTGLDFRGSFSSMVVAVAKPTSLAKWDLMDVSADAEALTNYMEKAIETRLAELGVSDEIALHMTVAQLQKPTADCGELRMLLSLRADEVELDGRSVVAVTVHLSSWAGAFAPQQNGKAKCLGDKGPPWSGVDGSKIFLVDRGDRDKALAETKQAILHFVDSALLHRLIASNATALRTALSLTKGGN